MAGADGNLYFTENAGAGRIGQITTLGAITEFSAGLTSASGPWGIANGSDGNIWFTENAANQVGRLTVAPGAITDPATQVSPAPFPLPATLSPVASVGPSLPPATRPVFGKSATIATASGEILVQLPGTAVYLPLSAASTVPVGTTIDATRGALKLTNVRSAGGKLQTGRFWGGSFRFRQTRGKQSTTVLTLTAPLSCAKSARQLSSATANKPRVRQLWGKDNHGRFVTRGRSAVATVRGTAWFTRDTCEGTLVKVTSGSVAVRDLVRKLTVIVRTGHTYLARLK